MSLWKRIRRFFRTSGIAAAVEAFAMSQVNQAVAYLITQTEIGKTVAANIAAVENGKLSGAEKFAAVLANTTPLIVRYVAGGGFGLVAKDVEDIARTLIQHVYNDVQSTTAGKAASAILAAAK